MFVIVCMRARECIYECVCMCVYMCVMVVSMFVSVRAMMHRKADAQAYVHAQCAGCTHYILTLPSGRV